MATRKTKSASHTAMTVIDFGGGYLKWIEGAVDPADEALMSREDNTSLKCIGKQIGAFTKVAKGADGRGKHDILIRIDGSRDEDDGTPNGDDLRALIPSTCSGPCNTAGIPCPAGEMPRCTAGGTLECYDPNKEDYDGENGDGRARGRRVTKQPRSRARRS